MNDEDIKIISKYTLAVEDQASDAETSDAQRHDILSYKSDTDFILSRDHLTDEWKDFEKTSVMFTFQKKKKRIWEELKKKQRSAPFLSNTG